MRSWVFRFLALFGVAGCGVWIGISPKEPEPYITLLTAIASVLALFRDRPHADVILAFRPQSQHQQAYVFENIGDADATNLDMQVYYRKGQVPPVYQHETGLPLSVLYPRHRHLVRVFCVIGSGVQFEVEWWWTTRGSQRIEKRRAIVTLDNDAAA